MPYDHLLNQSRRPSPQAYEGPCECDLYLSCAKFVTTKAYAGRLQERRKLELVLAEDARERGWSKEVERHQSTASRIERLLKDLGEEADP